MMEGFEIALFLLALFICAIPFSYGIPAACLKTYNEGSAPIVLKYPACARWGLTTKPLQNQKDNCQLPSIQGRRKYQEDRISCNLVMHIPIPAKNGSQEARIGIMAVFDGQLGTEASEMASNLLLDYLSLHTAFITHKRSVEGVLPDLSDNSIKLAILKEALIRTFLDIDSSFSKKAFKDNLVAGSTAIVVLFVDGQILVANVGDSKALTIG